MAQDLVPNFSHAKIAKKVVSKKGVFSAHTISKCDRYIFTKKNIMYFHLKNNVALYIIMGKGVTENKIIYQCIPCNYITFRKNDYDKHVLTNKHIKQHAKTQEENIEPVHVCTHCNKSYKHFKSLYRHEKTCKERSEENEVSHIKIVETLPDTGLKNKLSEMEKQNNNILEALNATTKTTMLLHEKISQMETATVNNTTVNNNLNINLFLNNEYANAINLNELRHHLKLTLEDLDYTRNNGFAKGITNIFIKSLEELGPDMRPIHCSDANKKSAFYIKNEEGWEEDSCHDNINSAIDNVAQAQISKIKDWETLNPKWSETEAGKKEYLDLIRNVMGGTDDTEREINNKEIKKSLIDNVELNVNN